MDRGDSDLIPLEEELRFVKDYLDLEKMRLGSRLTIRWLISPETSQMLVPQMILLPLVENAIRYGAASSREAGWVEVESNPGDGIIKIVVRNSPGAKTSTGTGVGLQNVEARLKYLYSGNATVSLSVAEDRTAAATLALPALKPQSDPVQRPYHSKLVLQRRMRYASPHRR